MDGAAHASQGQLKFYPYKKWQGGGRGKVLAMLKGMGGGSLGSFNTGA